MHIDRGLLADAVFEKHTAQDMLLLAFEKGTDAQYPIRIHAHRLLPGHRCIGGAARILHHHVRQGEFLSGGEAPAGKARAHLNDALTVRRHNLRTHVAIAKVLGGVHDDTLSSETASGGQSPTGSYDHPSPPKTLPRHT